MDYLLQAIYFIDEKEKKKKKKLANYEWDCGSFYTSSRYVVVQELVL